MSKPYNPNMTKRRFLKTSAALVGAVAAPAILSSRGIANEPEPIKVGLVNPLEGECAQWGIPIVRGGQIWADEHNAKGGILCGDGERHKIEYSGYTNVCFYPNEELKAFKKALLEDDKKYMFQTYTPASRKAIAQLATQQKVLTNSYGGGFMSPQFPYLMGGITGSPTAFLGLVAHVLEKQPEVKKVALLFTDNSFGHAGRGYTAAGCQPYVDSDRIEVVYNEVFDPGTTDYFPLLSAVLETKPDAIFHSDLPPGKQAILLETAYHLGFEGVWMCHSWDLAHILQRVPAEKMEGRVYAGFGVDASEPTFSKKAYDMYETYVERYGAEDWIGFSGLTYSALLTFDAGFANAPSIDPTDVMNTLYEMKSIDHPIYGESHWGGKEIFGVDHHLLTPTPKYVVSDGGFKLSGVFDLSPWWTEHKASALPVLKQYGLTET
ncbi:MAG: ABC transporter substrate-binding protein [Kiloniellales bacterium]